MKHWSVACLIGVTVVLLLLSSPAQAKPKKKIYNNSADQVFKAALRTARERHVVTYVDEKTLMFTFETGRSFTSYGFVANASVEPEGEDKATLVINVQNKQGASWGAGDRMADKFYKQVGDELAGDPQQKSAVKVPEKAIAVPDPKAVPPEPSMIQPAQNASSVDSGNGRILVSSVPDGGDVYVDEAFVGNAPATLKLPSGKHTVKVSQQGYKDWAKEVSVFTDSEVSLKATLVAQGSTKTPYTQEQLADLRAKCAPYINTKIEDLENRRVPLPPHECVGVLSWMRDPHVESLYISEKPPQ